MENNMIPLLLDDTFTFSCSCDVPCFNECCTDLNQFLTPYDILRLKNHLEIPSDVFLDQYASSHTGPESGLPVISLKPDYSSGLSCPFVTPDGCSVYENRPSSCRTYPIARALTRSRDTGMLTDHYALLKEPHCLGFDQKKTQTVSEWINDQQIEPFNKMNDLLMEIISLKNQTIKGPLDIKTTQAFHMALYNLDRFRIFLFETGIEKDINVDSDLMASAADHDTSLLKIGILWVKHILVTTNRA